MATWFIRSPYRTRSWTTVLMQGQLHLTGLRSPAARAALAALHPGDEAWFGFQRQIWGVLRVAAPATPDPTAAPGTGWLAVLLEPLRTLPQPLPLAALRELPVFADSAVLRQPRLSVVRLSEAQAAALAALSL